MYEIKYKYCIHIGGINFPFNVFHSLHQFPFISFLFWVLLLYSRLALVNDVLYSFLPQSQFIHLSIYMIIAIYRKFSSYRLVIRRIQPGTEFRQDCIPNEYQYIRFKFPYFIQIFSFWKKLEDKKNFNWLPLQRIIFYVMMYEKSSNNKYSVRWCFKEEAICNKKQVTLYYL